MVHPDSHRVPRVPWYSGIPICFPSFRLQDFHPLRSAFPDCSALTSDTCIRTLQPRTTRSPVWALPASLAATKGISIDFSSWSYLDGSVHSVRLINLCIQLMIPPKRWVSPFGYLRIYARLAAPRSFSQPSASFIASCCQGIHHIHLNNYYAVYLFFTFVLLQDQSWFFSNFPFSFLKRTNS